jgi:nucleoside-diphosphate-sugar epimerase
VTRTVVVTGAGGFVGSHMAEGFLAMGDTVIATDKSFDAPTRLRLAGAEIIEAPLTSDILAGGQKVDLVIHGAAITTPPQDSGLSASDHIQANVALMLTGLGLAMSHGAADFVFLSSSGVFSVDDGDGVHLESTAPTANIPYAEAKRVGEEATRLANSGSLRATSVRLGPVYGPHEITRSTRIIVSQVRRWLDLLASDQPIIVHMPDERRDWTFAPDLPRALNALLDGREVPGVVHLNSGEAVSNLKLAELVAGLVSGGKVSVEPRADAPRLPMNSELIDLPSLYAWTPLRDGLAQTFAAEAAR